MEKSWELGEDLLEDDNLFDAITFKEIITTVQCNCRKLTPDEVKMEFRNILEQRLEDANFLLEKNIDTIIKYAQKGRS